MIASALISFGHFFAFFALSAGLVLQIALVKPSPDIDTAKRIQRADRAYGISAVLLLIFGFARVLHFDKGADYYFNNTFFLIKLALFVGAGLMSIRPTVTYMGWSREIKQGRAPEFSVNASLKIRKLLHYQLMVIAGVMFSASMMARGIG